MAQIDDIFRRYLENKCTKEELQILLDYFELDQSSSLSKKLIEEELAKTQEPIHLSEELSDVYVRNRQIIKNRIFPTQSKRNGYPIWKITGIAASLLLISFTVYWYINTASQQQTDPYYVQQDIEPGTNRAILELDNGKAFELKEQKEGIQSTSEGILYTDGTAITDSKSVQYASLTVPRKGQYQVTLSDGTKVWLNAESSLRYPVTFTGGERVVELQGEGYFEVAHDDKHPFIVKTKTQQVQVLGTVFTINAYENESKITTTLVSGSVGVKNYLTSKPIVLKPQEQAILSPIGYKVSKVDVTPFTAWKYGEFRFKATLLPEAIRQLERWYDLDVDYASIPASVKINVSISRNKKLSSVLQVLSEISDVKFKLHGRRLTMTE